MARPPREGLAQTPPSAQGGIPRILLARGLRAFGDGFVAILLPVHLARLGYGAAEIGLIATCTLLGSALLTLALGFTAHRLHLRRGLLVAGLLMTGTGLGFAYLQAFWPLLVVAFFGTLNPSGGDVSVFLPLEHALIANLASDQTRTAVYARYSFIGSIGAALGSLAVGSLDWLDRVLPAGNGISALFLLYGAIGLATLLLYARLPDMRAASPQSAAGLGLFSDTQNLCSATISDASIGGISFL
jgi:MFS family permease